MYDFMYARAQDDFLGVNGYPQGPDVHWQQLKIVNEKGVAFTNVIEVNIREGWLTRYKTEMNAKLETIAQEYMVEKIEGNFRILLVEHPINYDHPPRHRLS